MSNYWKVEEVRVGFKTFFRAVRMYGNNLIYKGGLWSTKEEAEVVAQNLNKGAGIKDDLFWEALTSRMIISRRTL